MEWESILLGFAMGLSSTIIAVRLQRSWQEYENRRFNEKVLNSLVIEIQNGLLRSKNLVSMLNKGQGSFGRRGGSEPPSCFRFFSPILR